MILLKLLIAHILGDFVLQSDHWVSHKRKNKIKSAYLYVHAFIIGLLSYLFIANWRNYFIPVIIFISHIIIDIWKTNSKKTSINFILDQLYHFLVMIIIWIWFYFGEVSGLILFLENLDYNNIWLIIFAYVFAIWPSGYIIGGITRKWQNEIENDGLDKAGMWIGRLERVLTLTFVFLGQYEALGFLIAAKSILRISVKKKEERKLTEYVLIGTMLSFSIAISIGIFIKYIIQIV
jgi:hypothetical protein